MFTDTTKESYTTSCTIRSSVRYVLLSGGLVLNTIAAAQEAPHAPTSINLQTTDMFAVTISWGASQDTDGWIAGYELVRNGVGRWIGDSRVYTDIDIQSGTLYHYNVIAVDNDGNRSTESITVTYQSEESQGTASAGSSITINQQPASDSLCFDDNGDGWGWNGYSSCFVQATGPNNTDTPTPDAPSGAICVDSDADGWGWDGQSSCRVNASSNPQTGNSFCVDEDGDGHGWDGYASCSVSSSATSSGGSIVVCIDSDGDGFGWDGTNTCRP